MTSRITLGCLAHRAVPSRLWASSELMFLRDAWEQNAVRWAAWARAPGHDVYSQFHARRFVELVPAPGRVTIDLGCGEGRLGRDLTQLGHRVIAVDASPTLIRLAATHGQRPLAAVL